MNKLIQLALGCFILLLIISIGPVSTTSATAQDIAPQLLTPADSILIDCGYKTGHHEEQLLFSWTSLGNSGEYQLQIAHNPLFNPTIIDILVPTTVYKSAALQCGQIYAWRVRVIKPVESQWSPTWSFVLTGGLFIDQGWAPEQLNPCDGCLGVPVGPVTFSWTPFFYYSTSFQQVNIYKLVLAHNSEMTKKITESVVAGNSYKYNGGLDYSTNYYWRLKPGEGDWSNTFSFQTESAPPSPAPPPSSGISCTQNNFSSPSLIDISPFLLGVVLLGLVFAGRQRPRQ